MVVTVDAHWVPFLSRWHWTANEKEPGRFYAYRSIHGGKKHVHMHRVVLEGKLGRHLEKGEEADHIDGNTLDNREANLRMATRQQQMMNCAKRKTNGSRGLTSQYKGVGRRGPSRPGGAQRTKPWVSRVRLNGKNEERYHHTELEAAQDYDRRALEKFGEFARTNF